MRRAVCMPGHARGTRGGAVAEPGVIDTVVSDVNLGAVRDVWSERVDGGGAEIGAKVDGGGYWQVFEVLEAESDDFSLGYEEGDFIFGLASEAA